MQMQNNKYTSRFLCLHYSVDEKGEEKVGMDPESRQVLWVPSHTLAINIDYTIKLHEVHELHEIHPKVPYQY